MVAELSADNAVALEAELDWFTNVLDARLKAYFEADKSSRFEFTNLLPPAMDYPSSSYSEFVVENSLVAEERLLLMLALIQLFSLE